jgi:uncharacterized membrane protein YqjE
MSHTQQGGPTYAADPGTNPQDASLGALVSQLSSQLPELIRSEMRLAQAEVAEKGKRAGLGLGALGGAAVLGLFGFGVLLAALVLVLDLFLPAWLAALIVALLVLAAAAVAGLVGKNKVAEAGPPKPERAMEGLKQDVATVKGDRA